jgi:hypothetical protein
VCLVYEPENPMLLCGLLEKAEALGINLVQIADNLPVEKTDF